MTESRAGGTLRTELLLGNPFLDGRRLDATRAPERAEVERLTGRFALALHAAGGDLIVASDGSGLFPLYLGLTRSRRPRAPSISSPPATGRSISARSGSTLPHRTSRPTPRSSRPSASVRRATPSWFAPTG